MSLNARYGADPFEEQSLVLALVWAFTLPVAFVASVIPLLWHDPPETLATLGDVYLVIGSVIATAFTLLLLGG
jgi:hypothetical protein